jgi:PGF-pre-PGF domain-containing protein
VFVLGFEGQAGRALPAEIRVDYESEALTLLRMDTGEPVGSDPIRLAPNESVTFGFEVATDADTSESFVETITYRATVPNSEIDIEFDSGSREVRIVTRLDPSAINETSDPDLTDPPTAIINRTSGDGEAYANEINVTDVRAVGADEVIEVGETVSVSGERSLVDTSYAVDVDRRLVSLFDIPADETEADQPATVRIPVDEAEFNGTDPANATVARRTGEDWQPLPTTVESREDGQVILRARTPGFSVFGVFARAQTAYTWETEDGRTAEGATADFQFDEPGLHRVNLTVTDSFGRSDTSTYRVLVNDRPSVDIEPDEIPANETVRLRADVTNLVGNESITWRFADGSTATGSEIEGRFDRGEVVNVTVEDEFGATGTDETVVGLRASNPILDAFQWRLGFGGRITVVVVLAVLIVGVARRVIGGWYYREERERERGRT